MKATNVLMMLGATAATLVASSAYARPTEAGDWDPRFAAPAVVTDRPGTLGARFDWWTASYAERKQWLETKYGVPQRAAAIAATGGMPLSHIDGEGRGVFLTTRSLGMSLLVRF